MFPLDDNFVCWWYFFFLADIFSAKKKKYSPTNEVTHPTETPLCLWYYLFLLIGRSLYCTAIRTIIEPQHNYITKKKFVIILGLRVLNPPSLKTPGCYFDVLWLYHDVKNNLYVLNTIFAYTMIILFIHPGRGGRVRGLTVQTN